jgi:hypothetical protein
MGSIYSLLYFFRILYFYKYSIKRWKTAIGIITNNEVKYKDVNDDGGWENSIEYTFNIGASIFVSDIFSKNIGFLHFSKDVVEINKNYPIGKSVTVFYNPKNPKDSIVEPYFSLYNLIYIFGSCVCLMIGYYMWK